MVHVRTILHWEAAGGSLPRRTQYGGLFNLPYQVIFLFGLLASEIHVWELLRLRLTRHNGQYLHPRKILYRYPAPIIIYAARLSGLWLRIAWTSSANRQYNVRLANSLCQQAYTWLGNRIRVWKRTLSIRWLWKPYYSALRCYLNIKKKNQINFCVELKEDLPAVLDNKLFQQQSEARLSI